MTPASDIGTEDTIWWHKKKSLYSCHVTDSHEAQMHLKQVQNVQLPWLQQSNLFNAANNGQKLQKKKKV